MIELKPYLQLLEVGFADGSDVRDAAAPMTLQITFEVLAPIVFDADLVIEVYRDGAPQWRRQLRADGWDPSWLPRGRYRAWLMAPRVPLAPGDYQLDVSLWHQHDGERKADARALPLAVRGTGGDIAPVWQLETLDGPVAIADIAWRRSMGDWFRKHFDHAARTIVSYFLGDSPLLRGRVLDVGCGDGITDLGVCLRTRPQEFVGIDPFRGFERLPQILRENGMPPEVMPASLRFLPADANALPFEDDHFDVVISWGSLEHIAGGYERALHEIRRVLKPGGLLFANPGLFYSDIGNHLGEFAFARREPYVHLKRSREELRELVLNGTPDYIDRSGEFATPAQYWQWFTELNPITVAGFEQELRAMDFEPWRVALRTHERVDYTPELQRYSFVDLAVGELYLSAWNRKPAR